MSSHKDFGHAMRKQFAIDPEYLNLNNGELHRLLRMLDTEVAHRLVWLRSKAGA
jgi:hypothetical protein